MRFYITAEAEFEADDIDDAFAKLEEHFRLLQENEQSGLLEQGYFIIQQEDR